MAFLAIKMYMFILMVMMLLLTTIQSILHYGIINHNFMNDARTGKRLHIAVKSDAVVNLSHFSFNFLFRQWPVTVVNCFDDCNPSGCLFYIVGF